MKANLKFWHIFSGSLILLLLASKNKGPVIALIICSLIFFFLVIKPVMIDPYKRSHLIPIEDLYASNVDAYYHTRNFDSKFMFTEIELPTPYYRGQGIIGHPYMKNNPEEMWNRNGWWQNQWKNYLNNKPSIYTNDVPLPPPYRGPNMPDYFPRVYFYTDSINDQKTYIT